MKDFINEELDGIRQFLKRNISEAIIIVFATLFITLDKYHPLGNEWQNTLTQHLHW
jgi:hypothetical protein